jgi:hypothetical protein
LTGEVALQGRVKELYAIGGAREVRGILEAMHTANLIAREL